MLGGAGKRQMMAAMLPLCSEFKNKPESLKITFFLEVVEGENISFALFVFHDASPCLSTE